MVMFMPRFFQAFKLSPLNADSTYKAVGALMFQNYNLGPSQRLGILHTRLEKRPYGPNFGLSLYPPYICDMALVGIINSEDGFLVTGEHVGSDGNTQP